MKVKQVIILRTDLNMRKGKMVAQGAHASMKVFLDAGGIMASDNGPDFFCFPTDFEMEKWIEGAFTKVCVQADSEAHLVSLYEKAREKGLRCSIILDSGLTEFNGVQTLTAVAIGPNESSKIDEITGDLKLL